MSASQDKLEMEANRSNPTRASPAPLSDSNRIHPHQKPSYQHIAEDPHYHTNPSRLRPLISAVLYRPTEIRIVLPPSLLVATPLLLHDLSKPGLRCSFPTRIDNQIQAIYTSGRYTHNNVAQNDGLYLPTNELNRHQNLT